MRAAGFGRDAPVSARPTGQPSQRVGSEPAAGNAQRPRTWWVCGGAAAVAGASVRTVTEYGGNVRVTELPGPVTVEVVGAMRLGAVAGKASAMAPAVRAPWHWWCWWCWWCFRAGPPCVVPR